jgi:hypothetical protein
MVILADKLTAVELAQRVALQPARPSLQWRENFARGVHLWRRKHHCPAVIGRASKDSNVEHRLP